MHLNDDIRRRVDEIASRIPHASLQRSAADLSAAYRDKQPTRRAVAGDAAAAAAYVVTRLPATYAAVRTVLEECAGRINTVPTSLLDLGAGCGAATLAARDVFPSLEHMTLIEENPAMLSAGRTLVPDADWRQANVSGTVLGEADLVIASYTMSELTDASRNAVLDAAWKAARQLLVIIEAGSTFGFAVVRSLRTRLLDSGAHMIAPCPHQGPCPMPNNDWCHFAARVERSALHRQLKHASLSYEDEKYSYAAVTKAPGAPAEARVVRRPVHHPGLVELTLCHGDRIEPLQVRKRARDLYREARHAEWGSPWPGVR